MIFLYLVLLIKWLLHRFHKLTSVGIEFFFLDFFLLISYFDIGFFSKLDFMIFLIFLSAELSWSYNMTCGFGSLTQADSGFFFA